MRRIRVPRRLSTPHILGLIIGLPVLAVLIPLSVHADTTISQGYSSSSSIPIGSLVSLKQGTSDQIVATSTDNVNNLIGVVINSNSSLLSLTNGTTNQVQVATNGVATVIVSDINGSVSKGDEITASPIVGVGMKATNNAKVVGIAQDNPSGSSVQSYKDSSGKQQKVTLAQVPVVVNVTYYYSQPDKTLIPSVVQNLANALAGKTVDSLPIIISGVIFIVTIIIVVSIIYSMIRSSIISVGRNPMSQSAVYRDVIQLSALVLGILAVAIIAIYVILTRL